MLQVMHHLAERRSLKTTQHDEEHRNIDGSEDNLIEEQLLHDGHDRTAGQDVLEVAIPEMTHGANDGTGPTHVSGAHRVPMLLSFLHFLIILLKCVTGARQTDSDDSVSQQQVLGEKKACLALHKPECSKLLQHNIQGGHNTCCPLMQSMSLSHSGPDRLI